MERDDILRILAEHRAELAEFGIGSLAPFGSFARGRAGPGSDGDLLVEFTRPVGLFGVVDVKEYLEHLLGRPVHLVTRDSLKRQLRERIPGEAIPAAERMDASHRGHPCNEVYGYGAERPVQCPVPSPLSAPS